MENLVKVQVLILVAFPFIPFAKRFYGIVVNGAAHILIFNIKEAALINFILKKEKEKASCYYYYSSLSKLFTFTFNFNFNFKLVY